MEEETLALELLCDSIRRYLGSGTTSSKNSVVGRCWVYNSKVNPSGTVAHLKARLVSKGYSQT